jgi:hypothetical protein
MNTRKSSVSVFPYPYFMIFSGRSSFATYCVNVKIGRSAFYLQRLKKSVVSCGQRKQKKYLSL